MFTLRQRQDKFRFMLPDEFIPEEINEKYTKILTAKHSFYTKPIDFLNETIQKIQVLGFNAGTQPQFQTRKGTNSVLATVQETENQFLYSATEYNYRSAANPESLVDKTFNVTFRHTLGFLNYFILLESFLYQYKRATDYNDDLSYNFYIEIMSNKGSVYSRIVLCDPLVDGMDMLDLDYAQPIANSQTFNVIFKYSNFDYQFLQYDTNTIDSEINIYTEDTVYSEPESPMYAHNRTYTKYDERTGEVVATVNPTIEDYSRNNSGIEQTDEVYVETDGSSEDPVRTTLHK